MKPTAIRIHRQSNTAREYDAIQVVLADLHLSCDLVSDRQISLAKRLADENGMPLEVAPELQARVARVLQGQIA